MLYNSEKREHESISGACVQAKIIRKEDKKIYLRIWNSGTQPAYNVNFYIPKGHRICVLRSRLECRMLKPGQAFDEYAVADEKLVKSPVRVFCAMKMLCLLKYQMVLTKKRAAQQRATQIVL